MTVTARWRQRPPGSNWGEFGPDDQLGMLNTLTPEKVRAGVAEVREGRAFCLSLPLDHPTQNVLNQRRHPPRLRPTTRNDLPNYNFALGDLTPGVTDVVCDDAALIHLQYSTQWDSLAHVGSMFDADEDGVAEKVFYNGYRGGEHIRGPEDSAAPGDGEILSCSANALGIENLATSCVQGRAVLVDLRHHFGDAKKVVGAQDLLAVMAADGVVVEPGDMLCIHTGFAALILESSGKDRAAQEFLNEACCALDGRDPALLEWISQSGIAALIADNYAVESLPARPGPSSCASLPLHEHCLFKRGIPLGELWHLSPLAAWLRAHRRNRFLLTAPPLRLPGAVGSPTTPVATV